VSDKKEERFGVYEYSTYDCAAPGSGSYTLEELAEYLRDWDKLPGPQPDYVFLDSAEALPIVEELLARRRAAK